MKLSKSTSYAINWLYTNGNDFQSIAKELNLEEDTVVKYLEKNNVPQKSDLATKSKPVKSSKELMIRHTREKQTNNVSIMTKEASEYNDSAKKKFNSKSADGQQHIFRPND